jgi:hypothetical protein
MSVYCHECDGYFDATHPAAYSGEHVEHAERGRRRLAAAARETRTRPTPTPPPVTFSLPAAWAQLGDLADNSELEAYRRGRRQV